MAEPFWKDFVDALKAREFESPYLDRLQEHLRVSRGTMTLEEEILQEMKLALTQCEDKANFALLELHILDEDVMTATNDLSHARKVKAYNLGVAQAHRVIWQYRIHREAIGLPWTDDVEGLFPLPRYRRLRRD